MPCQGTFVPKFAGLRSFWARRERMQLMRIVVVGAGRMGVIRAEDLAADGRVDEIVITNRNPERAAELAARVGGGIAPWPTDTTDPNAWPIA